jgi:hypothetical protein
MSEIEKIRYAFEEMCRETGIKPLDPVLPHWQSRPIAFDAFVAGWKARERQA